MRSHYSLIVAAYVLVLNSGKSSWVRGDVHYYNFVLKEIEVTKLRQNKSILTVNGLFPGPEIRVHKGDTAYVNVINQGNYGVTIHCYTRTHFKLSILPHWFLKEKVKVNKDLHNVLQARCKTTQKLLVRWAGFHHTMPNPTRI
ncbi:hypothetical protein SAY86_001739 [Trapa natans]|uniref:Plastocyanin-like domain-containing protein n=1 Tax=Trapa natans TaxID=22666 RepID=A0AAN7LPG3_TRANT|nr:hypothetical protein SAY86_001739 [Trapa natans]